MKTFQFLSPSITTISEAAILFFIRPQPIIIEMVAKNIQLLLEQEVGAIVVSNVFSLVHRFTSSFSLVQRG